MAKVKVAHAKTNELGTIAGGIPGDQTGLEVCTQDFFEYDWTSVLRAKSQEEADKIAAYALIIAENNHIGYSQTNRYTMYLAAKSLGWNFKAITTNCDTDCSQMVATILIACGEKVSPYMYTGNEEGVILATEHFDSLKYTSPEELKRGDILLTTRKGHTAIVAETAQGENYNITPKWVGEAYGANFIPVYKNPSTSSARLAEWQTLGMGNLFDVCDEKGEFYYIRIAGIYYGWIEKKYCLRKSPYKEGYTTTELNLRQNAGAGFKRICTMPKNAKVSICDDKAASNGVKWYYVIYNGLYGFCSSKYVK